MVFPPVTFVFWLNGQVIRYDIAQLDEANTYQNLIDASRKFITFEDSDLISIVFSGRDVTKFVTHKIKTIDENYVCHMDLSHFTVTNLLPSVYTPEPHLSDRDRAELASLGFN
ncbi:hypothetical protein GGF42_004793 [Coemansia sp. RSA 2424]|nr:hypothetical protein GGF42_004793 [Coemansia sp. RSA 2424]